MDHLDTHLHPHTADAVNDPQEEGWAAAPSGSSGRSLAVAPSLLESDRPAVAVNGFSNAADPGRTGPLFTVDQRILLELESIHNYLQAIGHIVPSSAPDGGPRRGWGRTQRPPQGVGALAGSSRPSGMARIMSDADHRFLR